MARTRCLPPPILLRAASRYAWPLSRRILSLRLFYLPEGERRAAAVPYLTHCPAARTHRARRVALPRRASHSCTRVNISLTLLFVLQLFTYLRTAFL